MKKNTTFINAAKRMARNMLNIPLSGISNNGSNSRITIRKLADARALGLV